MRTTRRSETGPSRNVPGAGKVAVKIRSIAEISASVLLPTDPGARSFIPSIVGGEDARKGGRCHGRRRRVWEDGDWEFGGGGSFEFGNQEARKRSPLAKTPTNLLNASEALKHAKATYDPNDLEGAHHNLENAPAAEKMESGKLRENDALEKVKPASAALEKGKRADSDKLIDEASKLVDRMIRRANHRE